MDMKVKLIDQMAIDLQIFKFNEEPEESYINRLLYSAIGAWIIQSMKDSRIAPTNQKIGVSKTYLTQKISNIVTEFLTLFPSFINYLDGMSEIEVARIMRENYEKGGFINSEEFGEFIIPAPLKRCFINGEWLLVRNDYQNIVGKAVGLGVFAKNNHLDNVCNIGELFCLNLMNAEKWTMKYIDALNWREAERVGETTKFFNPIATSIMSKSWDDDFPNNCLVTLYKTNDWDYGFAKRDKNLLIGVKIPDCLIGNNISETDRLFDNDVRRFMYGLKALYKNHTKILMTKKIDFIEINLYNALPIRELIALQFLGWKKKGICDDYNFLIPVESYETTKHIIENLSITVEER